MKAQIHPQWFPEAQVSCACGKRFTIGSTLPEIHVEVCSACHPFYTGQMRFVGGAGRLDRFVNRMQVAQAREQTLSKKERRLQKRKQKVEEELSKPSSLEDVRKRISSQ